MKESVWTAWYVKFVVVENPDAQALIFILKFLCLVSQIEITRIWIDDIVNFVKGEIKEKD